MPTLRRRPFAFRLRTLLIVTAIASAWVGAQAQWIRARGQALEHVGGGLDPAAAPWQLKLFGQPGYTMIWIAANDPAYTPEELQALFPEAEIWHNDGQCLTRLLGPIPVPAGTHQLQLSAAALAPVQSRAATGKNSPAFRSSPQPAFQDRRQKSPRVGSSDARRTNRSP